ncbi:hypothetical protein D9628_14210, partial [Staphylococcus aureus]
QETAELWTNPMNYITFWANFSPGFFWFFYTLLAPFLIGRGAGWGKGEGIGEVSGGAGLFKKKKLITTAHCRITEPTSPLTDPRLSS